MIKTLLTITLCLTLLTPSTTQDLDYERKGDKYIFVDSSGKKVSNEKFDKIRSFEEGLSAVKRDEKWGFVNSNIELVIPLMYEKVSDFKSGTAVVNDSEKYFIIDNKGAKQSAEYDTIVSSADYLFVKKVGKFGILSWGGELIEENKFDDVGAMYKDRIALKQDGKWINWSKGEFFLDDNTVICRKPDTWPIFSSHCLSEADKKSRKKCSDRKMLEATYQNIRYPVEARTNGVEGTVVIRFIITDQGEIEDAEIVRDIGAGCGEEALRVVKSYMNKWAVPGMHKGEAVHTIYYLPTKYRLE